MLTHDGFDHELKVEGTKDGFIFIFQVLIPPKSMQQRLRDDAKSVKAVLDLVKYRAEWQKYQEAQRAKEEEILERERVAYAQIDWHDFVVVETVDYQPFEIGNFPPPTTPEEVGARILIQERIEEGEDIEMQLESDEEETPAVSSIKFMLILNYKLSGKLSLI